MSEELSYTPRGKASDYNDTMAKPFKWTYQGKALMAYTIGVFPRL